MSALTKRENVFRPNTAFEELLLSGERTKLVSKLYKILFSHVESIERAKLQWEKDLGISWTEEQWEKLKKLTHLSCSCNTAI